MGAVIGFPLRDRVGRSSRPGSSQLADFAAAAVVILPVIRIERDRDNATLTLESRIRDFRCSDDIALDPDESR